MYLSVRHALVRSVSPQRCLTLQVSVVVFQGPQPTQVTDIGHSLAHFWTVAEFHRWAYGQARHNSHPLLLLTPSLLQDSCLLKWTDQPLGSRSMSLRFST